MAVSQKIGLLATSGAKILQKKRVGQMLEALANLLNFHLAETYILEIPTEEYLIEQIFNFTKEFDDSDLKAKIEIFEAQEKFYIPIYSLFSLLDVGYLSFADNYSVWTSGLKKMFIDNPDYWALYTNTNLLLLYNQFSSYYSNSTRLLEVEKFFIANFNPYMPIAQVEENPLKVFTLARN